MNPRKTVKYRYWNMMRNCGDAISAFILDRCFDLEPALAKPDEPHLSAVGSIIGMASRNSYIWGSGVLSPKWNVPALDPSRIVAVRGHQTRNFLRSKGFNIGDVPLGDPGIFVDEVLAAEEALPSVKYRAAIVPHHSAIRQPEFNSYRESDEFCLVDMIDTGLEPVRQIAMSDVVISQSLHGLVFAEALGKPSVWIAHTDDDDWCFKFHDWYSTTQLPQVRPLPLSTSRDELLKACRRADHTINKDRLRRSLPQDVIVDRPVEVPYQTCRKHRVNTIDLPAQIHLDQIQAGALDDKTRGEIQWAVAQAFKHFFTGWAEPTYACLKAPSTQVSAEDVSIATDYLDQNLKYEFAFIAPSAPDNSTAWDNVFSSNGRRFGVLFNEHGGEAVLLRPHGWFTLSSPHVTLVPLRRS